MEHNVESSTVRQQESSEGVLSLSWGGTLCCQVKAAASIAPGIRSIIAPLGLHLHPIAIQREKAYLRLIWHSAQPRLTNPFYVAYFKQRVSLCKFPHGTEQNLTKHRVQV